MVSDGPRNVIFDLGGVLIDWNPRYLYRALFDGDEPAMERFLAEVCTPDWNLSLDAGRQFAEAVAELSARHPARAGADRGLPPALAGDGRGADRTDSGRSWRSWPRAACRCGH